ncbi:MAG: membrane protein insertion efficiency factor YidD [Candidatus Levybacteria bacterium]|nr:membrane protein insertion efficiency factor YidD [Candidatus Levybacteria bacterium]
MKKLVLSLIRIYQKTIGFRKGILKTLFLVDSACRYSPTCSDYIYQAVEKYGVFRGSMLGLRRIVRCHPWSRGGWDPIK